MKLGDTVKRDDADRSEMRAYREMRGVIRKMSIKGPFGLRHHVQWGLDQPGELTPEKPERLVVVE